MQKIDRQRRALLTAGVQGSPRNRGTVGNRYATGFLGCRIKHWGESLDQKREKIAVFESDFLLLTVIA